MSASAIHCLVVVLQREDAVVRPVLIGQELAERVDILEPARGQRLEAVALVNRRDGVDDRALGGDIRGAFVDEPLPGRWRRRRPVARRPRVRRGASPAAPARARARPRGSSQKTTARPSASATARPPARARRCDHSRWLAPRSQAARPVATARRAGWPTVRRSAFSTQTRPATPRASTSGTPAHQRLPSTRPDAATATWRVGSTNGAAIPRPSAAKTPSAMAADWVSANSRPRKPCRAATATASRPVRPPARPLRRVRRPRPARPPPAGFRRRRTRPIGRARRRA